MKSNKIKVFLQRPFIGMKNTIFRIEIFKTGWLIPVIFLLLTSCSLIIEPDLTQSEVYLVAPIDDLVTNSNVITLWWDYVPDAEKYNLLIVSPGWESIEELVLDTNITSNKFTVTLSPGKTYSWGVSAFNSISSTRYSVRNIVVDSSSNLIYKQVVLIDPSDNYSTNETKIDFSWYQVESASSYLLDIKSTSWQGPNILPTQLLTDDSFTHTFSDGLFFWGVQARNDFSSTVFSTRSFIVDTKSPDKPTITYPAVYGDTLDTDKLKITWNRKDAAETESFVNDSIFIASDSLFTSSSITLRDIALGKEYSVATLPNGKYFCKVRSWDDAGNLGVFSDWKKFYISEE